MDFGPWTLALRLKGMVHVKICGITDLASASVAVEAGANALGFNFWRPGRRYVPPEQAAEIIAALPPQIWPQIWRVGVFVDEEPARVLEIAQKVGLSAVQLHGSESPEYLEALQDYLKVKAFRVDHSFAPELLARYRADAFLLDGSGNSPGGTGTAFDWQRALAAKQFGRIVLAGGLTPENVGEAVRQVDPWGVDVASGVEREPGKKDPHRVREFIRAVREEEKAQVGQAS